MSDVRDRLRNASEHVVLPDRPFDRMVERRDRKRRGQRLASAAVAFAIAAAAVGGGVILLSRMGQDQVVDTGGGWHSTKALALHPGEYSYLRVESSEAVDGQIRDEETWWGLDGSGEVRNRSTRQDKYPYPPSGTYGPGAFPIWSDVSDLSPDPSVLAAQLRQEPWNHFEGQPESDRMWDLVSFLLTELPTAPPDLRAALFDVARRIEGVTLTEAVRDPVGREAISLTFSDLKHGATWMMFFDPGTHQAMAWTFSSDRGGESWEIFESGIVDAAGAKPEGEQWLVPPLEGAAQ
jgi:hypothetical protein